MDKHRQKWLVKAEADYKADGKVRKKWVQVGVAFTVSEHQINIIMDTLPIRNWNGELTLFIPKDKEEIENESG